VEICYSIYDVIQIFNNNNLAYTNTILSVNSYILLI